MKLGLGGALKLFILISTIFLISVSFSSVLYSEKGKAGTNLIKTENELLGLINQERVTRNLSPLVDHRDLKKIARDHSMKMMEEKRLSHHFPMVNPLVERFMKHRLFFIGCAENIAYSETPVTAFIHEELMNSIPHRMNILHPDFTHCGIGIVSVKNSLYITQEFARLYVPLKKEAVEKLIEADLKDWFRETYNIRLTIFPQLKNHARLYSIQNLMGLDIDTSPLEWGKFYIVNFISPALEDIKVELRKEIKDMNLQGASVGATIGRNSRYPGGTYSLSILLFGNRYKDYSPQQLSQLIMTTINEKRKRNQIKLLKKNKKLSRKAENIAGRSYNHPENRFRFFSVYLVLTYKTENPRLFPPGVEEILLKKKGIAKNIGVGVFSPLSKKLPGNYFIVTFILKI